MQKNKRNMRRGVAIEFAIGTMLILVALSILLTTFAMIQTKHKARDLAAFEEKIAAYEQLDGADAEVTVGG